GREVIADGAQEDAHDSLPAFSSSPRMPATDVNPSVWPGASFSPQVSSRAISTCMVPIESHVAKSAALLAGVNFAGSISSVRAISCSPSSRVTLASRVQGNDRTAGGIQGPGADLGDDLGLLGLGHLVVKRQPQQPAADVLGDRQVFRTIAEPLAHR